MRNKFFTLLYMILFFSCSDKDKIPSDILLPEKMQKILLDIYTADAYTQERHRQDSALDIKKESIKLYTDILSVYKTDGDEFYKSYQFYLSRPDMLKSIMDSVNALSEKRRDEGFKPEKVD